MFFVNLKKNVKYYCRTLTGFRQKSRQNFAFFDPCTI